MLEEHLPAFGRSFHVAHRLNLIVNPKPNYRRVSDPVMLNGYKDSVRLAGTNGIDYFAQIGLVTDLFRTTKITRL